jgi:LacI family transcriptional regulator
MMQWLRSLPKPVGVVTWATQRGHEVIHACRLAGLLVPEEVAVLGADEDELICEMCTPPLSGVAITTERIGYEAAALLDRLMRGGRPPRRPILIEPTGVIGRQSTDTLAIDDIDLARAVAFIRNHATDPIGINEVLRAVPVSRSWLERRFKEVFDRTPGAEICRMRFEHAKRLLAETDMSVPDVAAASGYGSREYMASVFKSKIGLSPQKYRSHVRLR